MLIFALIASLTGCRRIVERENESISVYATFWPVYALTDAVMDGVPDIALKLMAQPQDGCLRSYQLSDWDAAILSAGADAVIMGGRGLESFESQLFGWGEASPAVSALLYNLELYNQDEQAGGEAESHLKGANPHLYLSVEGAKQIVLSAAATMQSLDPKYANQYVQNADRALERLDALLAENRAALAAYENQPVVLMNEALVYLARDYGFVIADWIDRESGSALIGNELTACLERLGASGAKVVLIEKQAPQALVEALEAAGYAVARLDVMSAHRSDEGFDAYLAIQADNARALAAAFASTVAREDMH